MSDQEFDLSSTLERISVYLPNQNPLKDFLHLNALQSFQENGMSFDQALAHLEQLMGLRKTLDIHFYRQAFREGRLTTQSLQDVIKHHIPFLSKDEMEKFQKTLLKENAEYFPNPSRLTPQQRFPLHYLMELHVKNEFNKLVEPLLHKLVANYLDQGISIWPMPRNNALNFYDCLKNLVEFSSIPLVPLSDPICKVKLESLTPSTCILACLKELIDDAGYWEKYLLEICLMHRGWAGLVKVIQNKPKMLFQPRSIDLTQFLAVTLLLELGCAHRSVGQNINPLNLKDSLLQQSKSARVDSASITSSQAQQPKSSSPPAFDPQFYLQVAQEALELSYYRLALNELMLASQSSSLTPPTDKPSTLSTTSSSALAIFCIDDRECSIRRHLELVNPNILTEGTPGFFNVDMLFQRAHENRAQAHCPATIEAQHLIREVSSPQNPPDLASSTRSTFTHTFTDHLSLDHLMQNTHVHSWSKSNDDLLTILWDWLMTHLLGICSSIQMTWEVLNPRGKLNINSHDCNISSKSLPLQYIQETDLRNSDGFLVGYSVQEMAYRVYTLLASIGVQSRLPSLVMVIGHTSTSSNNPYFTAYGCGACAGKPGGPNARVFALMANHPLVRDYLNQHMPDLHLSESTYFIGAEHDTTADTIEYYDTNLIPPAFQSRFNEFKSNMNMALARNAQERCRRFELVDSGIKPDRALSKVFERSRSIFEPRPELGHTNNALCIVGRRSLSRDVFLDRRSFLNSYDPTLDPDGCTLESILNAVIPVCGGINLDYYFSRLDNLVLGSGTKLPHNVAGLLGVVNGVEGDMLFGLPTQMIELHDPIRLMLVIEQRPQIVEGIINNNDKFSSWIKGGWMHCAVINSLDNPLNPSLWLFKKDKFENWSLEND